MTHSSDEQQNSLSVSDHHFTMKALGKKGSSKEKKKDKADHRAERVEAQLEEIYENADGTLPDMEHFELAKGGRLVRAIVALGFACTLLAAVAWAGFFLFQPKGAFTEEDVVLVISGESEPSFGQEVVYRVRYANAQPRPLARATLEARYPKGFIFEKASVPSTDEKGGSWTLGSIGEDEGDTIEITGRFYGEPGNEQTLRFFLNYTPGNFSSEFQKVSTFSVMSSSFPINLVIEAPESVGEGEPITATMSVEPANGTALFPNALFLLGLEADGFHVTESIPEKKEGKTSRWPVTFEPKTVITFKGFFEPGVADPSLKAVLFGRSEKTENGEPVPLAEVRRPVALKKSRAGITLQSKSHESGSLQPGDVLFLSLAIKNTSKTILKKPSVRLVLDTPSVSGQSLLFWNKLNDPYNGEVEGEQISAEVRRGVILWDRRHIPNFVYLGPGEEVAIDIQIPVKTKDETELSDFRGASISATAYLDFLGDNGKEETVGSANKSFTVHSDLDIKTEHTLSDKTHKVSWIATNTMHPLSDITVSADLFGDITWHDDMLVVPAGSATYDKDAKRLVWQIPKMPLEVDVLALQFSVTLESSNPNQTQLTSKPIVNATDTVTGAQLLAVGKAVEL